MDGCEDVEFGLRARDEWPRQGNEQVLDGAGFPGIPEAGQRRDGASEVVQTRSVGISLPDLRGLRFLSLPVGLTLDDELVGSVLEPVYGALGA